MTKEQLPTVVAFAAGAKPSDRCLPEYEITEKDPTIYYARFDRLETSHDIIHPGDLVAVDECLEQLGAPVRLSE